MSLNDKMELNQLSLETAITLLKKVAKDSHLEDQKHLDLSLCTAEDRPTYERALMRAQAAVAQGEITQEQLKQRLGLE